MLPFKESVCEENGQWTVKWSQCWKRLLARSYLLQKHLNRYKRKIPENQQLIRMYLSSKIQRDVAYKEMLKVGLSYSQMDKLMNSREFRKVMTNRFTAPSSHTIRDTMIPSFRDDIIQSIREIMCRMHISISCDEYQDSSGCIYIGVIAASHRGKWVLRFQEMESCTAVDIVQHVQELLNSVGIQDDQVVTLAVDSAASMKAVARELPGRHVHCIATYRTSDGKGPDACLVTIEYINVNTSISFDSWCIKETSEKNSKTH